MEEPEAPPPTGVDVLNDDGLDALFAQLEIGELTQCARTCRTWRAAALQPHRWEHCHMYGLGIYWATLIPSLSQPTFSKTVPS